MAIKMGDGGAGSVADINMTPMIDVLLVLLVIFMIAQPMLQKSIDAQLPKDEQQQNASQIPRIVLEIASDGSMSINTQPVPPGGLEERIRQIYANREDRVIFVKPADDVEYQLVIAAMDQAKGAGIEVIGAVF